MTELLLRDFKSFEEQLIIFIQTYYKILKQDEIDLKTEEGRNALIQYLLHNTIHNHYMQEFLNHPKFDFLNHICILQLLFEKYQSELKSLEGESIKKKQCLQSNFNIKMTKTISKELINYRNYIAHGRFISDEHIQRIYEDEYFYLHYINLPIMKNVLSLYSLKQIKLNIKNILAVNLTQDRSFTLYYQGYQELLPNIGNSHNNGSKNYLKDSELIDLYSNYIPKKLFDFDCFNNDILNDEEANKKESEAEVAQPNYKEKEEGEDNNPQEKMIFGNESINSNSLNKEHKTNSIGEVTIPDNQSKNTNTNSKRCLLNHSFTEKSSKIDIDEL